MMMMMMMIDEQRFNMFSLVFRIKVVNRRFVNLLHYLLMQAYETVTKEGIFCMFSIYYFPREKNVVYGVSDKGSHYLSHLS